MYTKSTDKLSKTDLEALKNALTRGDMQRISDELGVHRNTVQYTFDPTNTRYNHDVIARAIEIVTERILEQAHNEGQLSRALAQLEHLIQTPQRASA